MKETFKSIAFTIADLLLIYIVIGAFSLALFSISEIICSVLSMEYLNEIILNFIQCLMFIIIPIFTWKVIKRRELSDMGLKAFKSSSSHFIQGLIMGIISITICFIVISIIGNVDISFTDSFDLKNFIIYLILFILVGFDEEIFARGYILSTISTDSKKGKFIAIFITSLIFADLHLGNNGISTLGFINIFLVGILYGYMYYLTNSIWMSIGCHITWNFFEGAVFGFNVSGAKVSSILVSSIPESNLLNGGSFGIEGSIICTIVLLLQLIYIHKKFKKDTN